MNDDNNDAGGDQDDWLQSWLINDDATK